MLAVGLGAVAVERQRVILKLEPSILGNLHLALFDFCVDEFLDPTALQAHQMIVMLALIEFKQGSARLEVASLQDARLLELGKHPVHRGQADVLLEFEKLTKYVFGAHVTLPSQLEDFENLQAWAGSLEANAAEFRSLFHPSLCIISGYASSLSPQAAA